MPLAPHHFRLTAAEAVGRPSFQLVTASDDPTLASSRRIDYTSERCFEVIAEALMRLRPANPQEVVVLEADGDPCLRFAYPYDRRVFVMPAPSDVYDVFRTPEQAAVALRKVMEDTASFAAEIFGLFDDDSLEEDLGGEYFRSGAARSWNQSAVQVDEIQISSFLDSPLGVEIASRIQLQPEYHGLVESDVILINTGVGGTGGAVDEVLRRLEVLLNRIRARVQNDGMLFCCDPCETQDPRRIRLFEKLSLMSHALLA